MQLSRDEFLKVSTLRDAYRSSGTLTASPYGNFAVASAPSISAPGTALSAREARQIADAVEEMPDRDEIVASLRARIESGTYQVSAQAIAEMMLRRMMADRVL